MLDDDLQKLSEFIKKIEAMDSLDFVTTYFKEYDMMDGKEKTDNREKIERAENELNQYLSEQISNSLSESAIIHLLYLTFVNHLKRNVIYSYAIKLGIPASLYKRQMRFLFKGVPLD